ncbi:MAG: sortase [Candidatus Dormibacteraeota bacterium]|nr:sortase [Candidatus Dormibacteraeota bacterium]
MSEVFRVRKRRKSSLMRRLTRPVRRLGRVSKLRIAIVVAMVLAAAGGAAALVLILSGPREEAPATAAAPPLALGPAGLRPARSVTAATVPLTTRLIAPAGGIDISVVQGDGVTVPLGLAVHYPGTDQPGGGSNALFYAHARPGMFQGLYKLHVNDSITAVRADGSQLAYHVAALEYVPYNDLSVLNQTQYDEMTLLTCTSYDSHTPRFIVIALPGSG